MTINRQTRSDHRRQGILARDLYSKSTLVAELKYRNSVQEKQLIEIKSRIEQVESTLKCSICYEIMYAPTTLPCGHSYCMICINDTRRFTSLPSKCPTCREPFTMSYAVNVQLQNLIIVSKSLNLEQDSCRSLTFYEELGLAQMWQRVTRRPTRLHSPAFIWPTSTLDLLQVICFLTTLGVRDHPNAIVDLDLWKDVQAKFLQILPDCSLTIHRKTDMVLSSIPDQISIDIFCRLPNFPLVLKAFSTSRHIPQVTNSDILTMFFISTKY